MEIHLITCESWRWRLVHIWRSDVISMLVADVFVNSSCVRVHVCAWVCVCACEREREMEGERERAHRYARTCMYVVLCVCACPRDKRAGPASPETSSTSPGKSPTCPQNSPVSPEKVFVSPEKRSTPPEKRCISHEKRSISPALYLPDKALHETKGYASFFPLAIDAAIDAALREEFSFSSVEGLMFLVPDLGCTYLQLSCFH